MILVASIAKRLICLDVIPDYRYGTPAQTVYKPKVDSSVPVRVTDSESAEGDSTCSLFAYLRLQMRRSGLVQSGTNYRRHLLEIRNTPDVIRRASSILDQSRCQVYIPINGRIIDNVWGPDRCRS